MSINIPWIFDPVNPKFNEQPPIFLCGSAVLQVAQKATGAEFSRAKKLTRDFIIIAWNVGAQKSENKGGVVHKRKSRERTQK